MSRYTAPITASKVFAIVWAAESMDMGVAELAGTLEDDVGDGVGFSQTESSLRRYF